MLGEESVLQSGANKQRFMSLGDALLLYLQKERDYDPKTEWILGILHPGLFLCVNRAVPWIIVLSRLVILIQSTGTNFYNLVSTVSSLV